jgi:hypothetical protein
MPARSKIGSIARTRSNMDHDPASLKRVDRAGFVFRAHILTGAL